MPNTKAIGVAFADPEFESVTVTGAVTAASVAASGAVAAASVAATGKLSGTQLALNAPVIKTASFSLADNENFIVCNGTGSITVTFPTASANTGRMVWIKTIAAQAVASASSNVKPIDSNTAGTAIVDNVAGNYAVLVCDGTNWVVMAAN
jgi:hypothetical protein